MDVNRVAVDQWAGLRTFSWARFAVMLALIGTPGVACAWLLIRQPAPDRPQPVPAAAQADFRPLVIVIPNTSGAPPRHCAQEPASTPAPSDATPSFAPGVRKTMVQGVAQSRTPSPVTQPPTATADAEECAVESPPCLPGSVVQTAASNPAVPQLPALPSPGQVPSAPTVPLPNPPAPVILPPAPVAAPSVPAAITPKDDTTGTTALGVLTPDGVQPPPSSPSLVLPVPGSGPQDAKKPLPPNAELEFPAPNLLPIGIPPNHPMSAPASARPVDVPQPTEQELATIRNHVEGFVDANCVLDLEQGRTRLLKLKKPARSVHVSGTEVINCMPVNGREIAIQARAVGTTLLHLTFGDDDNGHDAEIRYLVRVSPALTAREPYEAVFRALEAQIAGVFPESKVQLKLVGEAVLVTGQVRDARDATAIVQLVIANTPWADRHVAAGTGEPLGAASGSPHVINRLQIARAAPHQVTLKVAVVELSRSALWSLCGKGPEAFGPGASPQTNYAAGPIVPVMYELADGRMSAVWGAAALSSVKPASGIDGRPMPEPRQILLQGQHVTVVATGQCLVTAPSNKTPAEQRAVTLGLHGLDLSFTPVGVEGESFRIAVAASAARPGAAPHFHATVAMHAGQTLAFAGLLPPFAQERDLQRTTGRWTMFGRYTPAPERETMILILPEVGGAH